MRGQRYWISSGTIACEGRSLDPDTIQKDLWLHREGRVRITTGVLGTEVTWCVQSPCLAALYLAMEVASDMRAPFVLRFHAMGWFEESHSDVASACARIEDIIAHGDRYLPSRIFVKPSDLNSKRVPGVIRQVLLDRCPPEDYSVDCHLDPVLQQFTVLRVGPKSAIGQVWGTYTSSQPCQPGGGYGTTVSEAYRDVVTTGRPRYDQVTALLRMPDGGSQWVPYHRAVIPVRPIRGAPMVSVVSQIAEVDYRVL